MRNTRFKTSSNCTIPFEKLIMTKLYTEFILINVPPLPQKKKKGVKIEAIIRITLWGIVHIKRKIQERKLIIRNRRLRVENAVRYSWIIFAWPISHALIPRWDIVPPSRFSETERAERTRIRIVRIKVDERSSWRRFILVGVMRYRAPWPTSTGGVKYRGLWECRAPTIQRAATLEFVIRKLLRRRLLLKGPLL